MPRRVASFLGKKITPQLAQEIGSRLSTRIEGRCIKHYMGAAGVKVYDKFSRVLRVETTVNDVSFFKHHRKVEHKDAAGHARVGAAEEDDLQPDRSARDPARLQPALSWRSCPAWTTPALASAICCGSASRASAQTHPSRA